MIESYLYESIYRRRNADNNLFDVVWNDIVTFNNSNA